MHVEAAAAHPLGEEKTQQFGWGGTGTLSPEIALHEVVGLELSLGAVVLSDGGGPDPVGVAPTEMGVAGFSTVGPRIRPLATLTERRGVFDLDGLWIAGGFGGAVTGGAVRPAVKATLGWDALSEIVSAGPFVGFVQVVEPSAESVRPEDARIAMFGLHGTLLPATRRAPQEGDRDHDGLLDRADTCPDDPEDRDGIEDDDGCPDPDAERQPPDTDPDGEIRVADACPNEPETINGIKDDDGCPDTEDLHVAGRFIVLEDRIHFTSGSAGVTERSLPLVARLAKFLIDHPEYAVVHVAGHSDDRGDEGYNMSLSEARGYAVRDLLVKHGVAEDRLTVAAYGESKPLHVGATHKALADNRRVELEIVERAAEVEQ